jgi:hypothetical protein
MKKSEVLAIRIDGDILDYLRQLAQSESRSIAKQVSHIISTHKARNESLKKAKEKWGINPKGN